MASPCAKSSAGCLRPSQIPIIMVNRLTSELSRVIGLEAGAEDYVTKTVQSARTGAAGHRSLRAQAEKAAEDGTN